MKYFWIYKISADSTLYSFNYQTGPDIPPTLFNGGRGLFSKQQQVISSSSPIFLEAASNHNELQCLKIFGKKSKKSVR